MTARELASLLHARRAGKGKWVAKCVAHPDRTPSLSIAEGRKGIVLRCMSHGCETKAILDVLGLQWSDLFRGSPDVELKGRLKDERRAKTLDGRFCVVLWLLSTDKPNRNYWHAAAKRIGQERRDLREKLDPKLKTAREFQERVKRLGWERVVAEWMETSEGKHVVERYGLFLGRDISEHGAYAAGISLGPSEATLRPDSLHGEPPELLPGWVWPTGK